MTNVKRSFLLVCLIALSGCGNSKLYHAAPPMKFQDIAYPFGTEMKSVNGVMMAYYDSKGAGQPIVLIHGLASNMGFWRYNIPTLQAQGVRVIAVDLIGYGKSSKPYSAPYTLKFYAETVRALLSELGITKATWVGHSMGGQIAMTAALHFPESVEKLVLLSPAGFEAFKQGEGDWLRNATTPDFVKKTPQERVRANITNNFYEWNDEWEWLIEERVRLAGTEEFDRFAYAVWKCVGAMLDEYVWDKLGKIQAPTLVLAGENDNLIPNPFLHGGRTREVMEQGVKAMPNAKLLMLPQTGHMIQIERSAEVSEAILNFLRSDALRTNVAK
ncbi:MAG: alpha/beta hydrolase [[Chlorobium] sp. 445]|nr:MAG: alpha/beta hydrolase [[Chlorobium] sp. 445]